MMGARAVRSVVLAVAAILILTMSRSLTITRARQISCRATKYYRNCKAGWKMPTRKKSAIT